MVVEAEIGIISGVVICRPGGSYPVSSLVNGIEASCLQGLFRECM